MKNTTGIKDGFERVLLENVQDEQDVATMKVIVPAQTTCKFSFPMKYPHTNRPGFWLGFIDFFTAGLFFLLYMPLGGLQDELDGILGRRTQRYWVAYLLGIPTAFIYPLIWMARIAEELKAKAIEMGIDGPYTSWWHMFGWNVFGILLMGPAVATQRFFDTLNKIESKLNEAS